MRVGQGFDAHRLVAGRRLVLGGVEIPAGAPMLFGITAANTSILIEHGQVIARTGMSVAGSRAIQFGSTHIVTHHMLALRMQKGQCELCIWICLCDGASQ